MPNEVLSPVNGSGLPAEGWPYNSLVRGFGWRISAHSACSPILPLAVGGFPSRQRLAIKTNKGGNPTRP